MLCTTPPIFLKPMWCDFQIKKINLHTLNITGSTPPRL